MNAPAIMFAKGCLAATGVLAACFLALTGHDLGSVTRVVLFALIAAAPGAIVPVLIADRRARRAAAEPAQDQPTAPAPNRHTGS